MKSITNKTKTKLTTSIMARRRAAANLLGLAVGIGLTIALGGLVYSMATGVFDSASTIATVEIQNARAYNTGDQAYISLSIKNTGTDAVTIETIEVLLDCSVANDGAAAALTTGTECGDATATTVPDPQVAGPGGLSSADMLTTDLTLEPGAAASASGTVETSVGSTDVAFTLGQEYLIEIEGETAAGEPLIQTATVRPR